MREKESYLSLFDAFHQIEEQWTVSLIDDIFNQFFATRRSNAEIVHFFVFHGSKDFICNGVDAIVIRLIQGANLCFLEDVSLTRRLEVLTLDESDIFIFNRILNRELLNKNRDQLLVER